MQYHSIASYHRFLWLGLLALLLLVSACNQPDSPHLAQATPTSTAIRPIPILPTPSPSPTTLSLPPRTYTSHILLHNYGRPDDLAFDLQGRLLFSDEFNGTISRLNADGSVSRILSDREGPEGLVPLPDGTLIFAEQDTNRIMSLAPGFQVPTVLRTLPGIPSTATCKHGVDGIALDPTNNTLIVPDSPTGDVYRMSLDGKKLTLLASGITRPVGADVDASGTIAIADECGHAFWLLTPSGKLTRQAGFGMPDDVLFDHRGNLLLIDLDPSIHALIRINLSTMHHETLASQGYIEPQGLAMNMQGAVFVSDDYANIIVKLA
jgi:streptogramin lyase